MAQTRVEHLTGRREKLTCLLFVLGILAAAMTDLNTPSSVAHFAGGPPAPFFPER
jgi:hypothetical protein